MRGRHAGAAVEQWGRRRSSNNPQQREEGEDGAELRERRGARPLHVRYDREQEARAPRHGGHAHRRRDHRTELGPEPIRRQLQSHAPLPRGWDREADIQPGILGGVRHMLPEFRPVHLLGSVGEEGVHVVLRRTHDAPAHTVDGEERRHDRGGGGVFAKAKDDRERRRRVAPESRQGDVSGLRRHRE